MSLAVSKELTGVPHVPVLMKVHQAWLPTLIFPELDCMKITYEMLEASNKSALLFQGLFSYSADKSTEHDEC